MIFASEKNVGGNDVGEVRDKFSIEICESEERADTLDR